MATILCIDDDPQMGSLIRRILNEQGHDVYLADNGKTGEEILKHLSVDLLITDVLMPEMDGIELMQKMRAQSTIPKMLVVSGGGRHQSGRTLLTTVRLLGVRHTLLKPFTRDTLIDAVNRALEDPPAFTHPIQ
ncbi:MAG: response regulator [Magnetococcales bacterium]|nr:response regulator [Magnetococcales bacterium]MBF0422995.1 response regulator [Magnetococcales bacterium]